MRILNIPTSFIELWSSKEIDLGEILKIVVDLDRNVIAVDEELHSDLEEILLSGGSDQKDLWGANLVYSDKIYSIEFTSFINIRPGQGNRSMEVEDPNIKLQIRNLIHKLIVS